MNSSLTTEYLWQFTTRAPILGLNQEDKGGQVAIFDAEGGLYLLDEHGNLRLELGFRGPIHSLRVVDGGKGIIVLDREGWLSRFDAKGKRLWEQRMDDHAVCMDARSVGQGIAVGCHHGLLTFHNAQGKKLRSLYLTHPIEFVKFAYDLPFLVAANRQGEFSLIDPQFKFAWKEDLQTVCTGIDVNCNASLILMTALTEGVFAFTKDREVLGAYDVGEAIFASALCQKGQRILAVNRTGRIHLIDRRGNLESYVDIGGEIPRLDLNYAGDRVAFQANENVVKAMLFIDDISIKREGANPYRVLADELVPRNRSGGSSATKEPQGACEKLWERQLEGGGEAVVRLTAHGAYCISLSEFNVLEVVDANGKGVWDERLDPSYKHRLYFSRAGNAVVIANQDYVEYFTCDRGKIKRLETKAEHISVHELGVNFAIATVESKVGLFDKRGQCVWSQILGIPILDLKVSPNGKGIFVACSDETLRLFRQEGKLGWEKKLVPKNNKVMLGEEVPYYNHKPVFHAEADYVFKKKVVGSSTNFALTREGILMARDDGSLYFMDDKGECRWQHPLEQMAVRLENLGQLFWVRQKGGQDLILDLNGQTLFKGDLAAGTRQFVKDKEKNLLLIESREDLIWCTNLTTNQLLWEHRAPTRISQFHVDVTGTRLAYLAAGSVTCLSVHGESKHSAEKAASQSVAFLEF